MKLYEEAIRDVQTSAQEAQALLHNSRRAIEQFEDLCRVLIQQGLQFFATVRATEDGLRYSISVPSRHFAHAQPLLNELDAMHCTRTPKWTSGGIRIYSVSMSEVPDFDVTVIHPDDHELARQPV